MNLDPSKRGDLMNEVSKFRYAKYFIFMLVIIIGLPACKTHEALLRKEVKPMRINRIMRKTRERDDEIISMWVKKYNATYYIGDKEKTFRGNYKIIKDSLVLISIGSVLGIEGVRILFMPDSVFFVDRINKVYFYGDYNGVKKYNKFDVDYNSLQNVLLNNADVIRESGNYSKPEGKKKAKVVNGNYLIKFWDEDEKNTDTGNNEIKWMQEVEIDKEHFTVKRIFVGELEKKRSYELKYSDLRKVENVFVPFRIVIEFREINNLLKADIRIKKVNINEEVNVNIKAGKKYKRIEF